MSWYPVTIYMNYHVCLYGAVAIPINNYHIMLFGGCTDGKKSNSETAKNDMLLLNMNRYNIVSNKANFETNDGVWSVMKIKGKFKYYFEFG